MINNKIVQLMLGLLWVANKEEPVFEESLGILYTTVHT